MTEAAVSDSFAAVLAETASAIEQSLDRLLPSVDGPERPLHDAMRYATLGGGKRLRGYLVVAGARMCGADEGAARRVAAAVEMVHAYSLVHDDLPAMDDDDMRRGKPSCHIAFDEATAILAGDALLTLAFEVLADPATGGGPEVRCELVRALAAAAGREGMVGGQMIDLAAARGGTDAALIARLERMKTGALIAFAAEAGAILAGSPGEAADALRAFGYDLGLAFQVKDDLLDVEGEESAVGKKVGKDAAAGKATFVATLGVDGARAEARRLADSAIARLDRFGVEADPLRAVCDFVLDRRR